MVGVPWSHDEFTKLAREVQHPFDKRVKAPPTIAKVLHRLATLGPEAKVRRRLKTLEYYQKVAAELRGRENDLHEYLDPRVRRVVEGKNICSSNRCFST